jgi:transposase InsO family protein
LGLRLQRECLYARGRWTSDEERALTIALYLAYYKAERPHIGLGGLPPLKWLRGCDLRPGDLT